MILIDPLPDSSIPLMKRVAEYSMQDWKGGEWYLDERKANQVFLLRAAVGENEGMANLNIAAASACTSILETSARNKFWCADSKRSIKVPIITLDGLLGLLPDDTSIEQIHVKIDTEGADLAVLRGAAKTLQRIDTVVIECNSNAGNRTFRDDECIESHALEYMKERHFTDAHAKEQGDLVNISLQEMIITGLYQTIFFVVAWSSPVFIKTLLLLALTRRRTCAVYLSLLLRLITVTQ